MSSLCPINNPKTKQKTDVYKILKYYICYISARRMLPLHSAAMHRSSATAGVAKKCSGTQVIKTRVRFV